VKRLKSKERDLLLDMAITTADLMNCVNMMPKGIALFGKFLFIIK
jgi:hypothetical protein